MKNTVIALVAASSLTLVGAVSAQYAMQKTGGLSAQAADTSASGEFIRAAYTKHKDDDDFGQPGTLVREVMDDAQRQPGDFFKAGPGPGARSADGRASASPGSSLPKRKPGRNLQFQHQANRTRSRHPRGSG